jgi:hypothetical protein
MDDRPDWTEWEIARWRLVDRQHPTWMNADNTTTIAVVKENGRWTVTGGESAAVCESKPDALAHARAYMREVPFPNVMEQARQS